MFCPPHNDRHDRPYEDEDDEPFLPRTPRNWQLALDTNNAKEKADARVPDRLA